VQDHLPHKTHKYQGHIHVLQNNKGMLMSRIDQDHIYNQENDSRNHEDIHSFFHKNDHVPCRNNQRNYMKGYHDHKVEIVDSYSFLSYEENVYDERAPYDYEHTESALSYYYYD
jgi:hypothetical protein